MGNCEILANYIYSNVGDVNIEDVTNRMNQMAVRNQENSNREFFEYFTSDLTPGKTCLIRVNSSPLGHDFTLIIYIYIDWKIILWLN